MCGPGSLSGVPFITPKWTAKKCLYWLIKDKQASPSWRLVFWTFKMQSTVIHTNNWTHLRLVVKTSKTINGNISLRYLPLTLFWIVRKKQTFWAIFSPTSLSIWGWRHYLPYRPGSVTEAKMSKIRNERNETIGHPRMRWSLSDGRLTFGHVSMVTAPERVVRATKGKTTRREKTSEHLFYIECSVRRWGRYCGWAVSWTSALPGCI